MVARADPTAVRVQSLGGFAVLRDGQSVKTSEWQSRRARELLKFLVARRGRPAPRPLLMEALWPDDDADRLGNRLSVALTTIRMVLDPQRRFGPGEFVHADKESVSLNLGALDVDLERFLESATDGLGHLRRGDIGPALPLLEAAEVMYAGDFLEENLYDDWATPPREEARTAYVAVARALAVHAVGRTDADGAVRYFLRILQVDRFDEEAHLGLVAALDGAGRHGEAHRQYLNYRHAMDELDVEPVAFPRAALRQP
jgi:DNA-binding SARP family transcriptional activator